ncbi:MAG: peptide deformylase [Patescibacteria group bacterium]
MPTFSIVRYPQPILQRRAQEVAKITLEIQRIIPQMAETMRENQGIGLAAPQIGISKRIIIVEGSKNPQDEKSNALAFINPRIVKKSREQIVQEEGCLSLPGIFLPIKRSEKMELICQTPEGREVKIETQGLSARIFQHEIDHLNGKLIIHRINPMRRLKIRKLLKQLKKPQKV